MWQAAGSSPEFLRRVFQVTGIQQQDPVQTNQFRQFAANVPPEESDLDSVQAVVIRRQLEAQRAEASEAALLARPSDSSSIAWKVLLVLLCVILAVEPLVANRS